MTAADCLDDALLAMAEHGDQPPCVGSWGHISDDPHERALAVGVCSACPIRGLCAAAADERRETFGVWGGRDRTPRTYKRRGVAA